MTITLNPPRIKQILASIQEMLKIEVIILNNAIIIATETNLNKLLIILTSLTREINSPIFKDI